MRIAEVSAFSQYSVGKIMRDIKSYIDRNTDDICEIFYARGNDTDEQGIHKYAGNFEIYINAINARIFDNDGFGFKRNTHRLIKALKEFKPDVVHIHCLHGYYMNVKTFFEYLKESKVKVVWTMHDAWAFTGHCCYFSRVNCEKWKSQCEKCPQKNEYPVSKVFDRSKKNYIKKKEIFTSLPEDQLKIVTPSNWLGGLIKQSFLKKYEVVTIHNGINTEIFNTEKSKEIIELPNKKILLGVASVWDERKGLNTFLELSKMLSDEWHIVLIGKLDKKTDFPANVMHITRTSNQEILKAYYQRATLFFNPTLDEVFGMVNLEAQACGCKVLSFETGGCKDTDCGNIVLMEVGDCHTILEQIKTIEAVNKNSIDLQSVSKETMTNKYIQIFI